MSKLKWLGIGAFIFVVLFLFIRLFTANAGASVVINEGWGSCVSTGPQCGTDNGTQSKTVYADFVGICPIFYHYQNNGNFNERCHRNNGVSHNFPEHVAPIGTSCPDGYTKSGSGANTSCSKVLTQSCHTGVIDNSACEPDITPTPTDTPTPTPAPCTENCGNPPTFAGSSTNAPVCSDGTTIQLPANPHVIRKGSQATVNFFITEGDRANIYWRVVGSSDWQNAVSDVKPNSDNFVSFEISGLDPNLGYDFGIQQVKGCGGGQIATAVIVDGPEAQTFRFTYWTW